MEIKLKNSQSTQRQSTLEHRTRKFDPCVKFTSPPKNRVEIKSVVKIFKEWRIKREKRSPKRCPPVDVEGKAKGRLGTALALARNVPRPREFVSRLNNQPT